MAVYELNTKMSSDGLNWSDITNATLYGTSTSLLDDMASKAQSNGVVARIEYEFEANGFEVRVADKTPEQWQQCMRACSQMERAAGATAVSVTVGIVADGNVTEAIRTMLHDLDNTHQVQLNIEFLRADI